MRFNRQINRGLILILISLLLSSCARVEKDGIDYTYQVAICDTLNVDDYQNLQFESREDLNLGFFRGVLWIKLSVENKENAHEAYMFLSNDRFMRDYKFFKLDKTRDALIQIGEVDDVNTEDYRTFDFPNPNFEIDLTPHEKVTYLIVSGSDGRTKDANFRLVSLKNYNDFTNRDTIWSFVFYTLVLFLVLINIYLWTIYRYRIYAFYILYLVSTLFVYLGIEGNLFQLGLSQQLLDHFIFIFLKLWVFSLILFTAKFLDIEIIAPRYYRFLKIALATILGGTLLFQIVFFSSSIQHLHFFENVLVIFWIVLIIGMLVLSAKNRWLALKYYMLPFSCFILFTILGVVNVHFQIVPINSFTFVKVGAIFEFTGYTYFITTLIKKKLKQSDTLEQTLKSQEALLAKKIDSSDFVSIFGLIESSMSSETEWDDFKAKVSDLDPNFVNLLLEKYPDLTKSEVRLLILIRVGYNQKEIANILNIDPSSVKKARTRARKKLGLEEADNLLACLRKLS